MVPFPGYFINSIIQLSRNDFVANNFDAELCSSQCTLRSTFELRAYPCTNTLHSVWLLYIAQCGFVPKKNKQE